MHLVEVLGRIFISALFLVEAIRKFFNPDISMMYMSDYGVPEFLFYPSLAVEFFLPILLRDSLLTIFDLILVRNPSSLNG